MKTYSENKPRYDYRIDLSNENNSHTKILKLIDRDKYVLEIGCATGYMTRHLKEELGCHVVCVEVDHKAAEKAKPYCEELLIEDIELFDFAKTLGDRRFDVVIMADILEHLKDPRSLLEKLRCFLTETGCILFSIPNGAHGSVALELLDGKWEYRGEGLLDRTHLRFFDKDSLSFLLDETGYIISQLERVIIHPRDTEMKTPWDSYPRDVTAYIEKVNPEYQTYQFIVKAHPASVAGWKKGLEDALESEKKKAVALEEKLKSTEVNLAFLKGKLAGFEAEFQAEKAEIRRIFEAEYVRLNEYITGLMQEKSELNERLARQDQLLNEIQSSLAWRLVTRYRRIIERCLPQNTRRRRFYNLCLMAPVVLFTEGALVFCRKIAVRIPVLKKVVPGGRPVRQPKKQWHPLSFPLFDKKNVAIIIPVYNQCKHTFTCLESILENTTVPYKLIVVDNASDNDTIRMLDAMEGIQIIRNQENKGFVTACNQGAEDGEGNYYLFLNNDTEVTGGWLEALLRPFGNEKVGIVGAKLVYPDGRLQEAGNIVWQDGTGWNYGRGDSPDLPQYSYLKEVDYCSGACLMIRKTLWLDLGGFDKTYAPAYYEDADLCFAARQQGYKVMYQPEAHVVHYEGASAGTNINPGHKKYQQVNLEKFREKWQEVLKSEHFTEPEELYIARERGFSKRVLVVDHYVPTFDVDAGSLRMFHLLRIFMELGYKVIFWPQNKAYNERYTRELQRMGVETLYGKINFEEYLKNNGKYIDVILLSRPNIAVKFIDTAKTQTSARIIYDTVDLHFVREERKAKIETDENVRFETEKSARKWKSLELFLANQADETLVVSPVEKEILEKEGLEDRVSVVSLVYSPESCCNPFEKREGLMFIGGFIHPPNEDGIVWFIKTILPIIQQRLPGIHLHIIGSHPTDNIKSLASTSVIVTGYVEDVSPYFEKARVFVSPLRYGAGIKGKIVQCMAYGLPVVTTPIGAEGMGSIDGYNVLIAEDEEQFADKVVKAYQDQKLWETLSRNSRTLFEQNYTPDAVKKALHAVLEKM
ncbi:MAG: O-antigen biosynthesis protein [Desulfobacteraceae bacterium Eth-SRB2]|nr:MAG: O-antigen biosynthesis protein [Desulfobacteraceae bacterium Eth-SRB2]